MRFRRLLVLTLALALVVGSLATVGMAKPKKKKPKPKPKPVPVTLYLHGGSPTGEADAADWIANNTLNKMDTTAPTDQAPKSMTYVQGTADQSCTGFPLAWPYWAGSVQGKITGDIKVTLNFVSAPATAMVRLWADTPVFLCSEAYVKPFIEKTFDVPAGSNKVEVILPKMNQKVLASLSMTVWNGELAGAGRVLYDATGFDSKLEFRCVPASGKSCTP